MQRAGGGQEIVVGVFRADARLDGMAADLELALRQRQRLARGDAQLPFHQVLPGDRFGHRMLDLQARVHLHEEENHGAVGLLFDDELDRAGAYIVDGAGCRHRGLAHRFAKLFRDAGRRGFLEHLLMAALHRAVALEQVNIVALGVTKHLDFDMARALHVLFDQHRVIAKAVDGFTLARGQRAGKVLGLVDRAHALATTTRARLDQHRVTDAVGLALQQCFVLIAAVIAGHQRHAGFFHELLGLGLEAHGPDA